MCRQCNSEISNPVITGHERERHTHIIVVCVKEDYYTRIFVVWRH